MGSSPKHRTAEPHVAGRSDPATSVLQLAAASQKSQGSTVRASGDGQRMAQLVIPAPSLLKHYQAGQQMGKTARAALKEARTPFAGCSSGLRGWAGCLGSSA